MKPIYLIIFIFFAFFIHSCKTTLTPIQPILTKTTPMKNTKFPRIEIYFVQDYGNKNTGNDKTTDPNGKVVYMGRADYQPYVNKRAYVFTESEKEQLLALQLTFLPYFREQKPTISLKEYFNATENNLLTLFPKNIDGYLKYSQEDDREFFETIIEYQKKPVESIVVIWLDETHWYVNNVFYRVDLGAVLKDRPVVVEEQIAEGTLKNFIRFSNVIQPKLDEGYAQLRLKQAQPEFNNTNDVLTLSLSPERDGSANYVVTIKGNGSLEVIGNTFNPTSNKVPHYKIVALLTRLNKLTFESSLQKKPSGFGDNKQTLTLKGWQNGEIKTLQYEASNTEIPSSVNDFFNFAFDLLADELGIE
ncbi:MAG: hypothetical protein CVU03_09100 [Bacteroidetes bacterium HGW-Bacteroidetes-2]|jgi:hypothetical protein|nr:MAG: hypothetical protein CVU03_09100 [Bacteroidetes bacterium HGW-Bacteroidetes-2]